MMFKKGLNLNERDPGEEKYIRTGKENCTAVLCAHYLPRVGRTLSQNLCGRGYLDTRGV
jgi:hypothetical protein